jgi:hypothetical protein
MSIKENSARFDGWKTPLYSPSIAPTRLQRISDGHASGRNATCTYAGHEKVEFSWDDVSLRAVVKTSFYYSSPACFWRSLTNVRMSPYQPHMSSEKRLFVTHRGAIYAYEIWDVLSRRVPSVVRSTCRWHMVFELGSRPTYILSRIYYTSFLNRELQQWDILRDQRALVG